MPILADVSNLLFPAGMALLVVVLLRLALRRGRGARGRKTNRPGRPQPLVPSVSRDPAARQLSDNVELHEALRDLRGEVSTRIGLLEQHTLSARQEADRLEAVVRRAEALGLSPVRDTLTALQTALEEAGADDSGQQLEAALGRISAALAPHVPAADQSQVRQLAEEGLSPAAIASQLELPLGDVELLLQFGPQVMPPAKSTRGD